VIGLEAGIVGRDRELIEFYVDVLDFSVTRRLEFTDGLLVKLRRDDARVKIFFPARTPTAQPASEPYWELGGWRYAALCFDDLDAMHALFARIEASKGSVVMAPTSHRPGAEAALVADPEGNHWELLWEAR
jgi:uncharacterized glyoxalase superfamily protein PhnB